MEPPALPWLAARLDKGFVCTQNQTSFKPNSIFPQANNHVCTKQALVKYLVKCIRIRRRPVSSFTEQLCFLFPCLYLAMYNLHIPLYNRPLQFWVHYHFEASASQILITSVKYKVEVFTCWCLFIGSSDFCFFFKYISFWRGWHGTRDKWSAHFRTKSFCSKTKFFPLSRDKSFLNLPHILSAHLVMTLFWKLLFLCVGLVCKNPYMVLI